MKFKSATLNVRETTTLILRTGVELTVGSLPMGIEREYQSIWPKPTAPYKEINKVGQAAVKDYNYDDPDFDKAFNDWTHHRSIYYMWRCIYGIDANITFEFDGTTKQGLVGVSEEFKLAGFSDMDISAILKAVQSISVISEDTLQAARKSF